jgi:hypothetical protein
MKILRLSHRLMLQQIRHWQQMPRRHQLLRQQHRQQHRLQLPRRRRLLLQLQRQLLLQQQL